MTLAMIAFLVLTAAIILSGAASVIAKQETTEDYLLAGRSVPDWLAALSTVATNNSGFMFIGMIAATYRGGVETVWMMVGWLIGDWLAWQRIYPRLRARSGASGTVTLTAILATGPEGPRRKLVVMASVLNLRIAGNLCRRATQGGQHGATCPVRMGRGGRGLDRRRDCYCVFAGGGLAGRYLDRCGAIGGDDPGNRAGSGRRDWTGRRGSGALGEPVGPGSGVGGVAAG